MRRRKFILNTAGIALGDYALSSLQSEERPTLPTIKPKGLIKGDLIGITAPAGCIWNLAHVSKIEKILADLGFRTAVGKTVNEQIGFLAGNDEMRANELMEMYQNKSIRAILTMRGCWGCARILDLLDYEIIKSNPKVLMGFSDITSLINAIYTKTGMVTYHGPCGYSSWGDFSTQQVINSVVKGVPFTMKNPDDNLEDLNIWSAGKAQGELVGGNLTVVASMIGTNFEPNWKGKLLFLEEISEEPYRVDRMLWQMKQAGVFNKINGLIIGELVDMEDTDPSFGKSTDEIVMDICGDMDIPIITNFPCGHGKYQATLPISIPVELNANLESPALTILESPVS